MRHPRLRPVPASFFVATLVAEAVAVALSWGLGTYVDTLVYVVFSGTMAGAGALIASYRPRNPIGWLLCVTGLGNALASDVAHAWGLRAAEAGWPGGPLAEWIVTASWMPQAVVFGLVFLLFPDGHLLDRRWRFLVWLGVIGVALGVPGWTLDPGTGSEYVAGVNPYAVESLPTRLMFVVGTSLAVGSMVVSIVPLVMRFRRSRGVERLQLKCLVLAASVAVVLLPLTAVLWDVVPIVQVLVAFVLAAIPLAVCVAILRYRLYDVDLVISRTLVYAALTVVLGAVYVVSVVLLGIAVGRGSAWATAGATLVAAALFRPVRTWVQDRVDRRFRRARYDALQRVTTFLDELRAGRAEPEEVERVLRAALDDQSLELRFRLSDSEPNVDIRGQAVDTQGGDRVAIERAGAVLGWAVRDPGTEEQRALLPSLLDAAGLAIEMARLRVDLRRRLHEAAASRARLDAVADDERRRIERDLHDGAQQRLVSIGLALRHVQHRLGSTAPEASRDLDNAVAEITVAIEEMRELARGLRPAQLEAGLGPALRELAGRVALPVEVSATSERFTSDVEGAAYFVACEGLTNAVKHARAGRVQLSVARENSTVVVRVDDDGVGGAVPRNGSGLSGLSDRVASHGGTLRIESGAGRGTTLIAEIPCAL